MKAPLLCLLFAAPALGQYTDAQVDCWIVEPVQCCPGGCCPPQPYYQQPPRRYQQPAPNAPPEAGSPNAPKFQPRQDPPLVPIQPAEPAKPPEPTIDPKALEEKYGKEIADLRAEFLKLTVQVNGYSECNCGPKWAALEARLKALESKQPKPIHIRMRNPKSGALTEYVTVNPGQYVTIDLEPFSQPAQ